MNAYDDEDGNVVLDVCRYEDMMRTDNNGPFRDSLPTLDRWTVNPGTGKVSEDRIDDRFQEFPRCHPSLNSKAYRYGYAVAVEKGDAGMGFPSILWCYAYLKNPGSDRLICC